MSWNYRIVDYGDGDCAMHEVHYDAAGKITGWTGFPRQLTGETPQSIADDLELMLADAKRLPPLSLSDLPGAEELERIAASRIEARSDKTRRGLARKGESLTREAGDAQ